MALPVAKALLSQGFKGSGVEMDLGAAGCRSVGATVSELAAQLGLAQGTVLRWSTQSPHTHARALLPVTVVPDAGIERRLSVVSPSGFLIEELTFAEAAALLKALE